MFNHPRCKGWPLNALLVAVLHTLMAPAMTIGKERCDKTSSQEGERFGGVVENEFVVLDLKNPTPREEELLQPNDQALDMYEVLDDKAFESIKIVNMLSKLGQG